MAQPDSTPARAARQNRPAGPIMGSVTSGQDDKLDRLLTAVGDVRLMVATMSGEQREMVRRLDANDGMARDFENRLRVLERAMIDHSHGEMTTQTKEWRAQQETRDRDIEVRLRSLERFRYAIPSAALVMSALSFLLVLARTLGVVP